MLQDKLQIQLPEGVAADVTGAGYRVVFGPQGVEVFAQPEGKRLYPLPANDNAPLPELRQFFKTGQLVEGKGIYVGIWEPTDNLNKTLGKVFDLYAAPEDISNNSGNNLLMTFNDAVRHVAGQRNWHGHDGNNFANEKAVTQAVRTNPDLLAKWFIPTKEILHGKNAQGTKVQPNNLYDHRTKMPRGAEFVTNASGSGFARWYWSLTERPDDSSFVYIVSFTDGDDGWDAMDYYKLSVRPVRAELRL